jgi:transposase-like protein
MGRRSNYTAKQKTEVVLSVLTKQTTIVEACGRHGISETTFMRWKEQALEQEIAALERKLGQVTMIADIRGEALQRLT